MLINIFLIYCLSYIWMTLPNIYSHRDLTHRSLKFSPLLADITKILDWTKTSKYNDLTEKVYVGSHIKHHKYSDRPDDPHSPWYHPFLWFFSKKRVFIPIDELNSLIKNVEFRRTKLDYFLYKYPYGPQSLFIVSVGLFGWYGLLFWVFLRLFIFSPLLLNWTAHKAPGYNHGSRINLNDRARNVYPHLALIHGGESLHGNHHNWPTRANFAVKWWEVDVDYILMKFLSLFNLVKIKSSKSLT